MLLQRSEELKNVEALHAFKGKLLTICALMDVSIRDRRHELLVAASLGVTVAFLRLRQSTLRGQVAGDVCWQIHLIWNRQRDFVIW